jgi:microcystin-dependent protein
MWGTGTAPSGWLLCAGAAVSRTTYATLFAVIGTTFGVGDGSTTFNVPNYTNRSPYGTTVGATGGSADAVVVSHTHTATSTSPPHAHDYLTVQTGSGGTTGVVRDAFGGVSSTFTTATTTATVSTTIASAGVSGTNANLPPYLGINFIIKT